MSSLRFIAIVTYLSIAAALCNGCTMRSEARVRTALDVIGQAGDGAYALAQAQCQREQSAYAAAGAQAPLEASIARCETIYDVFERIAVLHDTAATLLERGELAKAQDMLAQVSRMWAELRGGK